ncbi:tRNA uridine 5-carboxymethylaminomethyl modification enzyme [Frankliniella fusca]|uniref:tRNA uridine 5-carboxymethylaminomethyl modification enzyme n=1 Tax=Frankliniella fusca TaxID=407009 RepID=A0AAE1LN98_9NEOP|nr:tRNA uridine 5-carboxymethylaminomethyl modification enzyme [Frankliniella fusca]
MHEILFIETFYVSKYFLPMKKLSSIHPHTFNSMVVYLEQFQLKTASILHSFLVQVRFFVVELQKR